MTNKQLQRPAPALVFSTNYGTSPLKQRADRIIESVALLGVAASVADGAASACEIERLRLELQRHFVLSERRAKRELGCATERLRAAGESDALRDACDYLRDHLSYLQRLGVVKSLSMVLIADEKVHADEERYLEYVCSAMALKEPSRTLSVAGAILKQRSAENVEAGRSPRLN